MCNHYLLNIFLALLSSFEVAISHSVYPVPVSTITRKVCLHSLTVTYMKSICTSSLNASFTRDRDVFNVGRGLPFCAQTTHAASTSSMACDNSSVNTPASWHDCFTCFADVRMTRCIRLANNFGARTGLDFISLINDRIAVRGLGASSILLWRDWVGEKGLSTLMYIWNVRLSMSVGRRIMMCGSLEIWIMFE